MDLEGTLRWGPVNATVGKAAKRPCGANGDLTVFFERFFFGCLFFFFERFLFLLVSNWVSAVCLNVFVGCSLGFFGFLMFF